MSVNASLAYTMDDDDWQTIYSAPKNRYLVLGWTGDAALAVKSRIQHEEKYYDVQAGHHVQTRISYPGSIQFYEFGTQGTVYPALGYMIRPMKDISKRLNDGTMDTVYNSAFIKNKSHDLVNIAKEYNIIERFGLHNIDTSSS